ncbi:hypothetical protein D3C73_1278990 [compost metagenome]
MKEPGSNSVQSNSELDSFIVSVQTALSKMTVEDSDFSFVSAMPEVNCISKPASRISPNKVDIRTGKVHE